MAPFVGRRDELDRLADLLRRTERDSTAAALIRGLPGTGKSRLLAEVRARSTISRRVDLIGFEPTSRVPLGAAGHLLRELGRAPGVGSDVLALAFGNDERRPSDALPIFEVAFRALSTLAPVLITVDDVQWFDDLSLGLLHYLVRASAGGGVPLGVVCAARTSPAAAALADGLEASLPPEQRVIIELGPLALAEGVLLARALNHALPEHQAVELWRRAGGSPFWLETLARQRIDVAQPSLLGERLSALGSDAGALLAVLSVGSRPFARGDLAQVLEWPEERLRDAVSELVTRGLAVEKTGELSTAHDLIREATMNSLPATTRRRLHAALAHLIGQQASDDLQLLREALGHRHAAGLPTAALALRLAHSPQRRLLSGDELRLLASICDQLEPGSRQQLSLDEAVGELAILVGEPRLCLERWRRVAQWASDERLRQHAHLAAAQAAYALGESDEVRRHLEAGRAAAGAIPELAIRFAALAARVQLWLDHTTAGGSKTAADALSAADLLERTAGGLALMSRDARRAYLDALGAASDAALQEDRHADLIELQTRVVSVARSLGDDETYVMAMIETGRYSLWRGEVRQAERWFRQAWEAARTLVLPVAMIDAGGWLGRTLHALGRLSEARVILNEAVELESRVGRRRALWGTPVRELHGLELSLGDPASALASLRRDAEEIGDPHYRLGLWQTIAEWLARYGGRVAAAEVERSLAAAGADLDAVKCPRCGNELAIVGAELLARIGRLEQATERFAAWNGAHGPDDNPIGRLWRTRARASIAHARGEAAPAAELLEELIGQAEAIGRIDHVLWARLDLGDVLGSLDRQRAIDELQRAAQLAERIGAASQYRLAARRLRQLGVRSWRRDRSHTATGLSARELEVASLVAAGASNREVGESLLISPKTVERHVSNLLAKLGVRNRTELASVLRSSGLVRDFTDDRRPAG